MGFNFGHALKGSLKFSKNVFGGGYLRDGIHSLSGGGNNQRGAVDADFIAAQNANTLGTARASAERRRAIKETRAGFSDARSSLTSGRAQAVQYAEDQARVDRGGAQQGLINRGLLNTTNLENANAGISSGLSKSVADIGAHYDQILGELGIGEASAVSGIRSGNAAGYQRSGEFSAGLHGQHANILANAYQEDDNEWLNALLGIGGQAAGIALGKAL